VLFGVPEIVGQLIAQPRFRRAPTGLFEAQRHVSGNPVPAIEQFGQGLTRHAKALGRLRHLQLEGPKAILANNFARMGWLKH
jgi:hypothetical protein